MSKQELPFLAGHHVVKGKGTGLVHTAPAHGHDDFQLAVRHGIPIVSCTLYIYKPNRYVDEVEYIFCMSAGILDVYIYEPNFENNVTYTLTLNLI